MIRLPSHEQHPDGVRWLSDAVGAAITELQQTTPPDTAAWQPLQDLVACWQHPIGEGIAELVGQAERLGQAARRLRAAADAIPGSPLLESLLFPEAAAASPWSPAP